MAITEVEKYYVKYLKRERPLQLRGGNFRECVVRLDLVVSSNGGILSKKNALALFGSPDFTMGGSRVLVYKVSLGEKEVARTEVVLIFINAKQVVTGTGKNTLSALRGSDLIPYDDNPVPLVPLEQGVNLIRSM